METNLACAVKSFAIVSVGTLLLTSCAGNPTTADAKCACSDAAEQSTPRDRALALVSRVTTELCGIPVGGKTKDAEISAQANGQLANALAKLASLGFDVKGSAKEGEYSGLRQEDLLAAIKERDTCNQKIWDDLKRLVVESSPSGSVPVALGKRLWVAGGVGAGNIVAVTTEPGDRWITLEGSFSWSSNLGSPAGNLQVVWGIAPLRTESGYQPAITVKQRMSPTGNRPGPLTYTAEIPLSAELAKSGKVYVGMTVTLCTTDPVDVNQQTSCYFDGKLAVQ